jgi:hypothetical protein
VYLRLLDRLLFRHPFEGGRARRYARHERPAFRDLDARLLDRIASCAPDPIQPGYVMELA